MEAPDDSAFLQSLRHSCARVNGVYPPMSLIEAYITEDDSAPRVAKAASDSCGLTQTQADGGQGSGEYFQTFKSISMQQRHSTPFQFRGSRTKMLISLGMSLVTRWMAATSRAIFYGPFGHPNNPSGASMPGKEIG